MSSENQIAQTAEGDDLVWDDGTPFDDLFQSAFSRFVAAECTTGQITREDRKRLIKAAHKEAEGLYYPADNTPGFPTIEKQQKALTKVLYQVLADEPWLEDWIRDPDAERKLSKFEFHEGSKALCEKYGFRIPKDAIAAACEAMNQEEAPNAGKEGAERVPFDHIDVIYIPGTVSADATNAINRTEIYPISIESVANQLVHHPCRNMTRPYEEACKLLATSDRDALLRLRKQASDICDFAPHLLDNDNITLLLVLLILTRSEVCKRFEDHGIRVEGSTMSHRKGELMKHALGWTTSQDKAGYDTAATEIQKRIKALNAPPPKVKGVRGRKPGQSKKRKIDEAES
ncbi:hypothetical protein AOQ84DRAFT_437705 [Glonium stellatum]|uniref:Uncharacterized protein n=1 Tax=Glonium stellatum TaxID=574774 RepID=A0A8E2F6G9_9PEZI|nr:hypothetical protein AOQ84DRAFT_437705 [Glonium stellatum]